MKELKLLLADLFFGALIRKSVIAIRWTESKDACQTHERMPKVACNTSYEDFIRIDSRIT